MSFVRWVWVKIGSCEMGFSVLRSRGFGCSKDWVFEVGLIGLLLGVEQNGEMGSLIDLDR
ncbi:hypothetical protein Hanom_Chr00s000005g01611661 [Helianthus anomalus]